MLLAVQGVIDYESASVYQLVVVARDRGHDPLSAECIVVIRVQDLNDNAPEITIRTLTSDVIGHLSRTPLAQVDYHHHLLTYLLTYRHICVAIVM